MTEKYKYCLLDLDGTVTDSAPGIINSVEYAFRKLGDPVPERDKLYVFIGPPLAESFERFFGFSKEKALRGVEYYREYYHDKGIFENSIYDGIPELLKELKARGAKVALATAKPLVFAEKILEHFGLIEYFDELGGATLDGRILTKEDVLEDLLPRLGEADKSKILMVGDRSQDARGAGHCGLDCLGALWGYGSSEELLTAGAKYLAETPADVAEYF